MRQSVYIAAVAALIGGSQAAPFSSLSAATQEKIRAGLVGFNPDYVHIDSVDTPVPEVHTLNVADLQSNITTLEAYVPEGESAAKEKRGIRGTDDRYYYSSTTEFPYRVIGKIEWSNGVYCTGSLVGNKLVLTAKHCWEDGATGKFSPAKDNGVARLGTANIAGAYFLNSNSPAAGCVTQFDMSVFTIDKDFGIGYFGAQAPDSSKIGQNILTHVGYAGDRSTNGEQPMRTDKNTLLPDHPWDCSSDGPLYTETDIMGGQSGGPLWQTDNNLIWGAASSGISSGSDTWAAWASGAGMVGLISDLRNKS